MLRISPFFHLLFSSFLFFARSFFSSFFFRGKEEGIDEERSVSRRLKRGIRGGGGEEKGGEERR